MSLTAVTSRISTLIVAAALACGALVATAGGATASVPTTKDAESYATAIVSMINAERKAHGLSALTTNSRLKAAATGHNSWMAKRNTLSHRLVGEHNLGLRVTAQNYTWSALGENIGATADWTLTGLKQVQSLMYAEGPGGGHYENIVSRTFRDVGVAVLIDAAHHKAWLTVDFGRQM